MNITADNIKKKHRKKLPHFTITTHILQMYNTNKMLCGFSLYKICVGYYSVTLETYPIF